MVLTNYLDHHQWIKMANHTGNFSWVDYVIFSLTLLLSAFVGVFWSFRTRNKIKKSPHHLLTGDRKLQILPVTMSLGASFLSAVFVIGVPTEVYANGGIYVSMVFCYPFTTLVTSIVFVPLFHKLQFTSAYEYLERRFSKCIRVMGSLTFTVEMIIYLGVVMYTPSLALSQVTGLSMDVCILAVGLVCTFYTSIGGIKAVVWTDVFQLIIIVAGLLALIIQGVLDVGGWQTVFDRATKGGRMPRFDFNPDPSIRSTFWTLNIGGFFTFLTVFGSNQATLQRYSSVKTLRGAQIVLWLTLPLAIFNLILVCGVGLTIYARYYNCDPFLSGRIAKFDQIVPLYMMDTLGKVPGLPGLFTSCIFSASLSTVSSGVNSLAAVSVCDYIKPLLIHLAVKPSAKAVSFISIVVSIFYGLLTIGLAYLAGAVGKTVLTIGLSVFGMLGGPILGLFLVGTLFPFVNSWGAGAGLISSLITSLWLGVGAAVNPVKRTSLSLVTDGCPVEITNVTTALYSTVTSISTVLNSTDISAITDEKTIMEKIYSLSYLHYSTASVIVSLVVSILVSLITGCNKTPVNPELYHNIWGWCCKKCLSGYSLAPTDTSFIEASAPPYAVALSGDRIVQNGYAPYTREEEVFLPSNDNTKHKRKHKPHNNGAECTSRV